MFNYRLFRTARYHTNYFYDLLRSGNFDKEQFKEDYLRVYQSYVVSDKLMQGLDFLLSYPQIIDDLTELRNILSNYNLKFDDVLKFDRPYINPLREYIFFNDSSLKHPEISRYDFTEAENLLKSYQLNSEILRDMGDNDQITTMGVVLYKEEILRYLEKIEPKIESAKRTVEDYNKHLEEAKQKEILPGYSHSFSEIENVAMRANQLIKNILRVIGESNIKMVKYYLKDLKFLKPLLDEPVDIPIEYKPNEHIEKINEKKPKSQEEFIEEYLQKYSLDMAKQNPQFMKKLGDIWAYEQIDDNLFSNIEGLKKILSEKVGQENIDFAEFLKSIEKLNKKFRVSNPQTLKSKKYEEWYIETLKYLEDNKQRYLEAKNYNPNIKMSIDQIKQDKYIIRTYEKALGYLKRYKEQYDNRAKEIIVAPYGKSLSELSELYDKILTSLHFLNNNDERSKFLDTYVKDDRFDALFGSETKFSLSRKFEILLENYISADRDRRLNIVKKLSNPIQFYRLLKSSYPDLRNILSENGLMNKNNIIVEDDFGSIRNKLIESLNIYPSELREVPSKYFSDFNLNNSSESEKVLFSSFEKLGLHAIPATQEKTLQMTDSEGNPYGFRIDFLLPCNVRVYDDKGNYSLREDIIFVGEYFGFYGPKYEAKTEKKIELQNMIENSLDQRCLHIKDIRNLCPVLEEKNIDCKCFPDYKKQLFDIENNDVRKEYFVKSQMQHFLYSYLIDELMWQINYNHSESTIINYEKIKEKNLQYIIRFENLIKDSKDLSSIELRRKCSEILFDYKRKFEREKKQSERLFKTSARYKITIR